MFWLNRERIVNYLLYNEKKTYEPQIDFTDLFDSSKLLISYNNSSQKKQNKDFWLIKDIYTCIIMVQKNE